jgi:hypothetical protein
VDFESRRLRVQLPCGSQTLIACVWGTCRLPSVITCIWRTPFCPAFISRCGGFTYCEFGTRPPWPTNCGTTIWQTETFFEQTELVQPVLEVDDLAILREQLEGQLKEVIAAQQTIAKQNKSSK